jgi:hypothetical protein
MYTTLWKKYLAVIKILMKRSVSGDQVLPLNKTDFEKDKGARKNGLRFTIKVINGSLDNIINMSLLAKDMFAVMQDDEGSKALLQQGDYAFSMNSKLQLTIQYLPRLAEVDSHAEEAIAEVPPVH